MGCNVAFERVVGLKKEQMIGKTVYEIAPKELADIYCEEDRDLFRNLEEQVYDSQMKYGNGSIRDVIFHKTVFPAEGAAAGGLAGVLFDISKLKKNYWKARPYLIFFMDHLTALVFMKDEKGRYIYMNKATSQFYNEASGSRIGKRTGSCGRKRSPES